MMRNGSRWSLVALLVAGCGGAPAGQGARPAAVDSAPAVAAPRDARVGRMTATAARAFIAAHPEALVLDVRNPDEWEGELGHIEGARLIPLPELAGRVAEVEAWKEQPVLLVCRSGNRSARAAELLEAAGFRQLINLDGGMLGWRASEARDR